MKTDEFKANEAYVAGTQKGYLFEDKNLSPVSACKVIELPTTKAYSLPVYKMDEDGFIDGETKPSNQKPSKEPIDFLCQNVDEMYGLVGEAYLYSGTKAPAYIPIRINNKSEVLNVIQGSLLDGLALNTVYDTASNILVESLKGFRVPLKLQTITKFINVWLPHTTNELLQAEYIENAEAISELYGNLCAFKVMIAPAPQRDQLESTWFDFRGNMKPAEQEQKRKRSESGRYPSPNNYLVYPNKEVVRVEAGKKICTGIFDALYIDQFFQAPLIEGKQMHSQSLITGYIMGVHRSDGATVLVPCGAALAVMTPQKVIDRSLKEFDSLAALANIGVPVSFDNLSEVRRLVSSSRNTSRGVGRMTQEVFAVRADQAFSKANYDHIKFY